ncbi:MAG TPA: YdiU family protein [Polyangia bacterium]|nr:YdiU family protein [Polyangia bacterium]
MSKSTFEMFAFDNSYARLPDRFYARVSPTKVGDPRVVRVNRPLAELLGVSAEGLASRAGAALLVGNEIPSGAEPLALAYAGHQFGGFVPQLGDGRAILLGEVVGTDGRRRDIQLKGSGRTPFSRGGDGRAALGPVLREYLVSEAMAALGIPTTRALAVATTGERVQREEALPGAILTRVAASHLRVGTFELFAARGDREALVALTAHALARHYPDAAGGGNDALALLEQVIDAQASLVARWLGVGFVHGVMNTDNMSILGLTIDYGPFGFLDSYDPNFTPNTTDAGERRYRFANQPRVAKWNLIKLAEALYPLIGSIPPLEEALGAYTATYEAEESRMLAAKLGLTRPDKSLVDELFQVLALVETDMTLFFRGLANVPVHLAGEESDEASDEASDDALLAPLLDASYTPEDLTGEVRARTLAWLRRYGACVRQEGTSAALRKQRMDAVNPKYVLRNCLAQLAIDAAEKGDASLVVELLELLRHPYDEQPERARFAAKRPDWARHRAGCSMLSCSS